MSKKYDGLTNDSIEAKSKGLSYGQLQQLRYATDPNSYRKSCRQMPPDPVDKPKEDEVAS